MQDDQDVVRFWPLRAVAQRLSLSPRSVQRLAETGELPKPRRISANRIGWRSDEIDQFIQSREVA
ncbi:helix-turn-helix transcriptional regulator [Caulobacter sp. KR2-114]|uniref:helix-turn-helix transcriptional regulator n=1 Tax=Caulobacter sp. KR2-114 TaxID=3400912 RepID=UPI003C0E35C8